MASRYLDAVASNRAHIRTLYMVIIFLMMMIVALWVGWREAPKNLRISIPPDLRTGAIVRPGEYQAATVYAFAMQYQQALNRWERDGAVDYAARIEEFQAYLTPKYLQELTTTMQNKAERGELSKRRRYTIALNNYEDYRRENVVTLEDGSWEVNIGLKVVEEVSGIEAKNVDIVYPLQVVRYNIDPVRNVWGLALNGMAPNKQEYRVDEQT